MIDQFIQVLGKAQVITGEVLTARYEHIWTMDQSLQAKALLLPKTTDEVSSIMKICNRENQSVVFHGGLTNLVGGTVSTQDNVVISLEKLNQIEELDTQSRTITVQAGVILENVQKMARDNGLLFPLNFGAKGSAHIGGAISTNAGGLRVLRYGMMRNLVLGVEAVLADGTIISSMKKIIKDNSAYDIKQLFIGSEGTLGVVTRAVLKLVEAPKSRVSAFVGFNEFDKVVAFLKYVDGGFAGILSGFELIWKESYVHMTSGTAINKAPLSYDYEYYVLIEAMGGDQVNDQNKLQELLEDALESTLILDAVIAQSQSDLDWFWNIREDVHVLKSQCTFDHHFDISLPTPLIGNAIDKMVHELQKIDEVDKIFPYGHVADGNIHFIIDKKNNSKELKHRIDEIVYAPLKEIGGSVSAEHGIGIDKKRYLSYCRSDEEIELMKLLKKSMDPKNILNPGKVLEV